MAITKSTLSALNSKIKIASRKLKSAKQDAARKFPGADVRVTTHTETIGRLTGLKGKPAAVPAR
jgi:hypothetical protein